MRRSSKGTSGCCHGHWFGDRGSPTQSTISVTHVLHLQLREEREKSRRAAELARTALETMQKVVGRLWPNEHSQREAEGDNKSRRNRERQGRVKGRQLNWEVSDSSDKEENNDEKRRTRSRMKLNWGSPLSGQGEPSNAKSKQKKDET